MKKRLCLLGLMGCLVLSCSVSSGMITMHSFSDVPVGSSSEELVAAVGKPYAIHQKEDGSVEYEYIERIKVGYRDLEERRYYILIKDHKIVSKRVEQSSPLPYGFDSYEMQTTQNGSGTMVTPEIHP